ncbi:MAG TPA: Holliday junction branch migration protein RuvA [Candidatus Aminicenantes bacterium]|nr:Holliday junction branch migration protein RuvA [Candidatus Aminicenantes bacterium]HRY65415.1 Holliday junction branch migration protein RuvA [Candidatus Aminicenantes bacterium]HRZ72117.1 Holliday junction branch migration protein RuvA [Candidatus Aminicenantes bacterium]
MIAYLRGTLIRKTPGRVVVETGGVGYEAAIPVSSYARLGETGGTVELFIHTHLSDDALALYGFLSQDEKDMFLKLIGVTGVGPKLALNVLSGIAPADLEEAIRSSDLARISLVPGIGKKTALRLTMELQDKLEKKEKLLAAKGSPEKEDLLSALQNMGFRRREAEQAADQALAAHKPGTEFEKLLRDCLRRLARI